MKFPFVRRSTHDAQVTANSVLRRNLEQSDAEVYRLHLQVGRLQTENAQLIAEAEQGRRRHSRADQARQADGRFARPGETTTPTTMEA